MSEQRMKELVDLINKYNYEYYILDKPTVSDIEYEPNGSYLEMSPDSYLPFHNMIRQEIHKLLNISLNQLSNSTNGFYQNLKLFKVEIFSHILDMD